MMRLFLLVAVVAAGFATGWYLTHTPSSVTSANMADPSYQYVNASQNDIFITFPNPGASVMSSVALQGYARGSWYDEGAFPVSVKNGSGLVIGSGEGKANGQWITNDFVSFIASVALRALYSGPAIVIITNGSGSASVSFPILIQ